MAGKTSHTFSEFESKDKKKFELNLSQYNNYYFQRKSV